MRSSPSSAGAKLLWLTLLTSAGLIASATAATVYAAGDLQRAHARSSDTSKGLMRSVSQRAYSARFLSPARHLNALSALADSLVAPLGDLPPVDSATLARMIALVTTASDSASWIAHAPADTATEVVMATYRRWARSAPLSSFWGARPGFPGLADSRAIPMTHLQPMKRMWKANEASADSALLRGDTETALMRARENISGARHFIGQPRPIDALVGRIMLVDGVKLLARSALQANDPSLHSASQRLLSVAKSLEPVPRGLYFMNGSDDGEARLVAIAGDRTLHPAARFIAIEAMVAGACVSTREVLFGPSAARHAAVNAMVDATRDIPRLSELRPAFHRTLDALDKSPERVAGKALQRRPDEPVSETLLRLVIPSKVQARIDACRWSGA
jgi:hypothetical protein